MEGRLHGLDALRGMAALTIAVGHTHELAGGTSLLFQRAYLAVDLFFMLSGYVMARTYEERLAIGLPHRTFMVIRLRRLWPPMVVGAALGYFVLARHGATEAALLSTVLAVAMIPAFSGVLPLYPTNPPAWSIFFELSANFLHAFVPKARIIVLAAIAVASGVALVALSPGTLDLGGYPSTFWLGFPRVAFGYLTGIVLWRVLGDRQTVSAAWAMMVFPAAILGAPYLGMSDYLFAFMLCPLLVASGLGRVGPVGRLWAWLGSISFPLYATHFPIVSLAIKAAHLPLWAAVGLALAVAWGVDALLHRRPKRRSSIHRAAVGRFAAAASRRRGSA